MTDAATKMINGALVQLGQATVASIEADPAPARVVKILPHLEPAIDAVLTKYGWLCALEYFTLQPTDQVPANWKFAYHYLMPAGGLRFWEVVRTNGWERGVFERADGAKVAVLRSTLGGAIDVSCVMRREADSLDANVTDAVVFELAARACSDVTGNEALALKLRGIADRAVLSAMGTDGQDARAEDVMFIDRLADLRAQAG